MNPALRAAATGMMAQQTRTEVIANNLANVNTAGFKRSRAQFEDLLYQNIHPAGPGPAAGGGAPAGVQLGAGSRVVATSRFFSQGSIQQTGNPLDVAIEGNGFLAVNRPNGEISYTRAGNLRLDAQGRMVTTDGLPIEPLITIPPEATNINIAPDGTISLTQPGQTNAVVVGQLTLVTFPNPDGLQAIGHNLFNATGASGQPLSGIPGLDGRGTFMQGALENSNVEVVQEMIGLIRAQRSYELNSKVISAADDMLRNATQMR